MMSLRAREEAVQLLLCQLAPAAVHSVLQTLIQRHVLAAAAATSTPYPSQANEADPSLHPQITSQLDLQTLSRSHLDLTGSTPRPTP